MEIEGKACLSLLDRVRVEELGAGERVGVKESVAVVVCEEARKRRERAEDREHGEGREMTVRQRLASARREIEQRWVGHDRWHRFAGLRRKSEGRDGEEETTQGSSRRSLELPGPLHQARSFSSPSKQFLEPCSSTGFPPCSLDNLTASAYQRSGPPRSFLRPRRRSRTART